MPRKETPSLVDGLIAVGEALSPEQIAEIELWEKGKALSHVVNSFAWEVILDTLKNYAEDADYRLRGIDPKHKDEVLAEHAVLFAADRIYHSFVQDVQNAVEASTKAPTAVKRGIRKLQPGPVESL